MEYSDENSCQTCHLGYSLIKGKCKVAKNRKCLSILDSEEDDEN